MKLILTIILMNGYIHTFEMNDVIIVISFLKD